MYAYILLWYGSEGHMDNLEEMIANSTDNGKMTPKTMLWLETEEDVKEWLREQQDVGLRWNVYQTKSNTANKNRARDRKRVVGVV